MIRTKEELIAKFKVIMGDSTEDMHLEFLEDLADTLDGDGKDWKAEYERNDLAWRERYKSRFLGAPTEEETVIESQEEVRPFRYEDLFKKGE